MQKMFVTEFQRRDIDCDLFELKAAIEPGFGLAASLAQHPLPYRHDEAAILGNADELLWQDEAARGMVPADQRFGASNLVRTEIDLGLVMQHEFLLFQRA